MAEERFCFRVAVLYPPLTFLKPTGRTQEVRVGVRCFSVVEVEPFLS